MLWCFVFQNVLLVIMTQSAILTADVRTMEFAIGFLEAVPPSLPWKGLRMQKTEIMSGHVKVLTSIKL